MMYLRTRKEKNVKQKKLDVKKNWQENVEINVVELSIADVKKLNVLELLSV